MERKSCKECPWMKKSSHNEKWPSYVESMHKSGIIENKTHQCHMIGKVWDKPSCDNVCIGSLNNISNGR